jgi:4Fe-4S iron-sulfur cluster binding domain/DR2241 stabilising domain
MTTAQQLGILLRSGVHRMGQIEIQSNVPDSGYTLCHHEDTAVDHGKLTSHHGPAAARDLSTYAEDGTYRFTKGQINLKRGWVMFLESEEALRQALDQFYPACLSLYLAQNGGILEIETLRDKLNRQTGMYRFARSISDAGAQKLVTEVCGPAHQCAKKILWQIDPQTPLDDSEASRFNGIPGDLPTAEAIPLLCREACNHFVAECRKAAKAEFEAKSTPPSVVAQPAT